MRVVLLLAGVCALTAVSNPAVHARTIGAQPAGAAARQGGTVAGTVWRHDDTPAPHVLVRLRNVSTGAVTATTKTDGEGRFTFERVPPGSYVVELVDDNGTVRAVGQVFGVGSSETVATALRLTAPAPWFNGFFRNAAITALATAATLGITAAANGTQPASGRN